MGSNQVAPPPPPGFKKVPKPPPGFVRSSSPGEAPPRSSPFGVAPFIKFIQGAGKGIVESGVGMVDLMRSGLNLISPKLGGLLPETESIRPFLEAEPGAEEIGKTTERVGEFFVPGQNIRRAQAAISRFLTTKKGAKAAELGFRSLLEAGSAGGVSAIQTGGEEVVDPALSSGVTTGALSAPGLIAPRISKALKGSAVTSISQALRPTTKPLKRLAEGKVAVGLLGRRTRAISLQSLLRKSEKQISAAKADFDDVLNQISSKKLEVRTKPINRALEKYKQGFIQKGVGPEPFVVDPRAVKTIEGIQESIQSWGDEVSFESIRALRQKLDNFVTRGEKVFGRTISEGSEVSVKREFANAIRRELSKESPELARVNAEYSFWSNVNRVVGETIERTRPQAPPLGERLLAMAAFGGGIAGGGLDPGGVGGGAALAIALTALRRLWRSPAWKLTTAIEKDSLAQLFASEKPIEAAAFIGRLTAAKSSLKPAPAHE